MDFEKYDTSKIPEPPRPRKPRMPDDKTSASVRGYAEELEQYEKEMVVYRAAALSAMEQRRAIDNAFIDACHADMSSKLTDEQKKLIAHFVSQQHDCGKQEFYDTLMAYDDFAVELLATAKK